jgi:short-subunit dehydrogenase
VKLFTEGLYAELRDTTVDVTVVFPGGVDTGIAAHSGVSIPGMDEAPADLAASMTSAPDAARQIVKGIEKGSYRVVIGKDARGLDRLSRFSPQRATDLVATKMASLLAR